MTTVGTRAPAPARRTRALRAGLLFATFACAACGLVYELALVAQGSYLLGDSVTQASVVLATMVFAMGIGSLAAQPLQRRALASFAVVEAALALAGGLSVLGLHAAFTWLDLYWPALIAIALLVGALIGAEIPLLMTLLQRIRRPEAGSATRGPGRRRATPRGSPRTTSARSSAVSRSRSCCCRCLGRLVARCSSAWSTRWRVRVSCCSCSPAPCPRGGAPPRRGARWPPPPRWGAGVWCWPAPPPPCPRGGASPWRAARSPSWPCSASPS